MYDTSFALSATVVSISTWVLTIIMPSIGFKLGKKNAKRLGYWLYALGPVILLIFGRYSCWVHTGTQVLAQVAYLVFAGFMAPIMIAEADRFYHKTGKDLRAVAPSLLTLPSTIGMAVGAAIMNYEMCIRDRIVADKRAPNIVLIPLGSFFMIGITIKLTA